MLAQSLSCPTPSRAFRSPSTVRLINGPAQPNERRRQTRFDRSLLDAQVLGDLLQRHSGEAMQEKDVAAVSRQVADRPDENSALKVFGSLPQTPPQLRRSELHRSASLSIPMAASTALSRSQMAL